MYIQTSLAVGDVTYLRKNSAENLFKIKVDCFIQVIFFYAFIKKCCEFLLCKRNVQNIIDQNTFTNRFFWKRINNVAVIYEEKNEMFTTNIDLGPEDTLEKESNRLKRVEFLANENIIIVKKEDNNSKNIKNDNEVGHSDQFKIENGNLEIARVKLVNREHLIKLKRWLLGINWNELKKINKKDDIDQDELLESIRHTIRKEMKALKKQIRKLR